MLFGVPGEQVTHRERPSESQHQPPSQPRGLGSWAQLPAVSQAAWAPLAANLISLCLGVLPGRYRKWSKRAFHCPRGSVGMELWGAGM